MIGDHNQLPPTVLSKSAQEAGLQTCFFERTFEKRKSKVISPYKQYRINEEISLLPSEFMYQALGQLFRV